jgi:hypothetical protein
MSYNRAIGTILKNLKDASSVIDNPRPIPLKIPKVNSRSFHRKSI